MSAALRGKKQNEPSSSGSNFIKIIKKGKL
jgi:hypothetical protein